MRLALAEAKRGIGRTSPNPMVGAVLVRHGKVAAKGFHRQAGGAHAEVDCLKKIDGPLSADAILYVTLEPCSTRGRTAPCADYILRRGLRRVVIGAVDPNPKHRGRAIRMLERAGVEVKIGVLAEECTRLNEAFNKWIVTGFPFVIAKCGMSLDGRLTRPSGESRWLTSAASRKHARKIRQTVDAILIGAETLRRDDPRLTAPHRRSAPPWRVVLSRSGKLPAKARALRADDRVLIYRKGTLRAVLADLGTREIASVLIEGGGEILSQALDQRLIDKVQIYLAPLLTGGDVIAFAGDGAVATADALRLHRVGYERIASDVCVVGYRDSE